MKVCTAKGWIFLNLGLLLLLAAVLYLKCGNQRCWLNSTVKYQDRELITLTHEEKQLRVEVVTTPNSQAQGLSGRDTLGADGMLFDFGETRQAVFWMKDMKFAIDIVWLKNGQVRGIESRVAPPAAGSRTEDLPRYYSPVEVDMVLELDAGRAQELLLEVGDMILLP